MPDTTLWCCVHGDNGPFTLVIDSSTSVGNLKFEIKKERVSFLQGIAASDLLLWKVRYL